MRYADLESHGDLGLGAEEPGTRRFTRPSERLEHSGAAASVADPRTVSGADVIRTEALDRLESRIARAWVVWEGLSEGQSRDNLAQFIHDLEDRADALTADLRTTRPGQKKTRGIGGNRPAGEGPTPTQEVN